MVRLIANSEVPDQTPRSAASDLVLHCLPITLLGSPDYNGLRVNKFMQLIFWMVLAFNVY